MRSVPILTLSFTLLLFACDGESKKERRSRIFGEYLQERFDERLPEERSYYLIIPHGCQGAIVQSLMDLDPSLLRSDRFTAIASNEEALAYMELSPSKVRMDDRDRLDELALPFHNLSLAVVEDGKLKLVLSDRNGSGEIGERIEQFLEEEGNSIQ